MKAIVKVLIVGLITQLAAFASLAARDESLFTNQTILHASEVYLLQSRMVDGKPHFYIEAVWRHNPRAGEAPAIGSEYTNTALKTVEAVVFIFVPRLANPDGGKIGQRGVPVVGGNVPIFGMSVDDLRGAIQSTQWTPSPEQ
jgi:hypothetical protein